MELARAIVQGDHVRVVRLIADAPELARWTTGRPGTGSAEARAQQREILRLLQAAGAV